jgi:hypothetical protein
MSYLSHLSLHCESFRDIGDNWDDLKRNFPLLIPNTSPLELMSPPFHGVLFGYNTSFVIAFLQQYNRLFPLFPHCSLKKICPNHNTPKKKPTTVNVPQTLNFVSPNVKKLKPDSSEYVFENVLLHNFCVTNSFQEQNLVRRLPCRVVN